MSETPVLKVHVGDEIDSLIELVVDQIQADIEMGDQEALYDFLSRMPRPYLINYLGNTRGYEAYSKRFITKAEYHASF